MRDATAPLRPAVFFDRDGTLIDDEHYLSDPARVRLRSGAVRAVRRARDAGLAAIVVTNQSGIGRGLFDEDAYARVAARVHELFAEAGAPIDASYHCPHAPDAQPACTCRKPGIALYQQAASEHALDLARSAFVGDRWRDAAPALRFGALGVLVPGPETPYAEMERARDGLTVATTLDTAIDRLLARLHPARDDG